MSLALTQTEADELLAIEKVYLGTDRFIFPGLGGSTNIPLHSVDRRENFYFDLHVGRIALTKRTLQNRARRIVVLARLDLGGPLHRNPDGSEIACPHLHVYKEGFGDKWAYPVPDLFRNIGDLRQTLDDFMKYCNITKSLPLEMELPYGDSNN